MAEVFSNNAVGTLADAITGSDTAITLADKQLAYNFLNSGAEGDFQRATLTGSDPEVFEIVHITEKVGLGLTVERGMEGTAALVWPAGSKLSARVTAGMLNSFSSLVGIKDDPLANFGRQFRTTTNNGQFVVNGRVAASYAAVQISGIPALQPVAAKVRTDSLDSGSVDLNMSHESVGATAFVELGDVEPATWTAGNTYSHGARVKPSVATGYYYTLELEPGYDYSDTNVAPAFDEYGSCPAALYGEDAEHDMVGSWVAEPDPLVVKNIFPGGTRILLSEVGFICSAYSATTPPSVNIGTADNTTLFRSNVALSQITGANMVHRIPVTPSVMQFNLRFELTTPADGGFKGRFYWRGLIVGV